MLLRRCPKYEKKLIFLEWNVVRFLGKDIAKDVKECVRVIEEMIFDGCIDDFP